MRTTPSKPVAPKTSKSTMGTRATILAGLAATGIALGLSGAALDEYIRDQANSEAGPDGGPALEPYGPSGPSGGPDFQPPEGDDGYDGEDGTGLEPIPSGLTRPELAWYLQTGNLPASAYSKKAKKGSGKSDGRSARAAVVRKVMREKGVSMIEASKYVKAHNLY
jgi:hypothetical protein